MKISLDNQEVAAILKDWAKLKYKTHNINVTYYATNKQGMLAELEVILDEDGFGTGSTQISEATLATMRTRLRGVTEPIVTEEPAFNPDFAGASEGI